MSFTCLQYHIIFGTKERRAVITPELAPRLWSYMAGIIRDLEGEPLQISGAADHVHIAAILNQKRALMDVVREIKAGSSKWVHEVVGQLDFGWQDGYSAFTVSESAMPDVVSYIKGQPVHHRKKKFEQELVTFLDAHRLKYDPRYLWT